MIVKLHQKVEGLEKYVRLTRIVLAKRMREDFMIETGKGWETGKQGDWLVNIGDDIWHAIENVQFKRVYKLAPSDYDDGAAVPTEERRVGGEDRRHAT